MKKCLQLTVLLIALLPTALCAQADFDTYFENKTLRLDYYHGGTSESEDFFIDDLRVEPYWGGSHINLMDQFDYGVYKFVVYDSSTGKALYSRGYSTLFSEWQTTAEAKTTRKNFSETVVMPFPKNTVKIEFYTRKDKKEFVKGFEYYVNPKNYFITPERRLAFNRFDVLNNGDPALKVDIVIIPDGYTSDQMDKFRKDCEKFAGYLFKTAPYSENKDKFNIWAVEAVSEQAGTDIPAMGIYKKTVANTSFYTFDLDRYCMSSDNKSIRDLASNAPYDQIYILVNSDKYGGGAIYNHYAVCVSFNMFEEYIFTHEFGHAFAGLGDEYYTSDVAYENFYPAGIEPWEPNLTNMTDFNSKWKRMLDKNTPVPTPEEDKYKKAGFVGVFEGGGYSAKGVYRPSFDCTMKSLGTNNFCPVCKDAISNMIKFYSE